MNKAEEKYTIEMTDPNDKGHSVAKVIFPANFIKSIQGITSMGVNMKSIQGITSMGVTAGVSYRAKGNVKASRLIGYTYVSEMPVCIDVVYEGYLMYDVESELFAGYDGSWRERSRDILIEGLHIKIPVGASIGFMEQKTMNVFTVGREVVMVPCKSHESRINGGVFVYQEFDWRCTFGVKSRSGKLSKMI